MRSVRPAIYITLILAAFSLASCSAEGNKSANDQTNSQAVANASPKTNAEELSLFIRMPFESDDIDDIVWKQDAATKKITAVFRLTKAAVTKLDSQVFSGSQSDAVSFSAETWFPEELLAQGEMNGDAELKGRSFPPTAFLLEPYNGGRAIRVDTSDYLVLELTAK